MPVQYSEDSEGPSTRRSGQDPGEAGSNYFRDISTTGAAADLAHELGIDLSEVTGTGLHGKVTKADVEKAAADRA